MLRSRSRRSMLHWALAAVVLTGWLAANDVSAAPLQDRVAVQRLVDESAWEAAAVFEFACLAAGIPTSLVRPVQEFQYGGLDFVRLELQVDEPHRCIAFLPSSRLSVDGSFRWFDGFEGGLLVGDLSRLDRSPASTADASPGASAGSAADALPDAPPETPQDTTLDAVASDEEEEARSAAIFVEDSGEDRIPDSSWYRPDRVMRAPKADSELVADLAQGVVDAVSRFEALDHASQQATLKGLKMRSGPAASLSLERIATSKALWTVRRAALLALDPAMSWETFVAASADEEAGIRLSVLWTAALVADGMVPGLEARSGEALELVLSAAESDPAWAVRRGLLQRLPLRVAEKNKEVLRRVMWGDPVPVVRAAALESLHQARALSRNDALKLTSDPEIVVRASGVAALVDRMTERDAPLLWKELVSDSPLASRAAVGMLWQIDDPTISPVLWPLYLREAELLDSNPYFLETVLAYLVRHPPPEASRHLSLRLRGDSSPVESRLLGRALGKIDPKETERLFLDDLDASDPVRRSIAADVLPNTPEIDLRRQDLIDNDPDSDVRASALIGLCRKRNQDPGNLLARAALLPTVLGEEALAAFQSCGKPPVERRRLQTALLDFGSGSSPHDMGRGGLLALLACTLLFGSVLVEKLVPRSSDR